MKVLYYFIIYYHNVALGILGLVILIGLIFYIKEALNERNDDSNH